MKAVASLGLMLMLGDCIAGIVGVLIANGDGIPLKSTLDDQTTLKVLSTMRTPQPEIQTARSVKHAFLPLLLTACPLARSLAHAVRSVHHSSGAPSEDHHQIS